MDGKAKDQRWGWGLAASVAVHAVVAALVVFGLPSLPEQQPEEEVIAVTLEPPPETPPPPEPAEPEQPPAEPEATEAPPPAEAPPAEPPPPEVAAAEQPPAPQPPEIPALETPPLETQPPATEPPASAPPPPAGEQAAAEAPLPVLDPVVRFGDENSGLRQSLDGAGARTDPEEPAPDAPLDEPEPAEEAEAETTDEEEPSQATEAEPTEAEPAETDTAPAATTEPEDQAAGEQDGAATDALVASIVAAPEKAEPLASREAPTEPAPDPEPALQEARTLFSRAATGDPTATTAMAGIPRGIRAGRLCATELRFQLLASAFSPDLLPSYRLDEGNVLKVTRGAFRAGGAWRNLSFECQIDANATSVRSFAFHVGDPLSPEETARRGLPTQ